MTAPGPIPIQPVSIRPELAPQTPTFIEQFGTGFQVVALALQRRAELEQARQQLIQDREKFELHKKLVGTQIEGMELEQEKKKREFKAQDEDIAARDEALRLFTGNLPQANDMASWGRIIAGVKNPLVGQHLMANIQEMFALRGQAGGAESTELQNQQRILGMAEDRQISAVLRPFANREWNKSTIKQAIGRVVAINPQKAGQVATALNALLPDYSIHINDDGSVAYVPKEPGPTMGEVKPKRATDEQNKLATYAVRVLEANATMTDLERNNPGIGQKVDDRLRALRTIEQIPAVGRPLATGLTPTMLRTLSPVERKYVFARMDLGNAFLRRASGAQINLEELDRETGPYVPVSGEDETGVVAKQQRRLQQGLLYSEQSGNAWNPNSLSPAARRYILQSIVPNPGYSPTNPYNKQPGTAVVPQ